MSLRISEVTSGKKLDIANNARINVKATPGEKYYLIDEATGQTPKDLEVFREGDALHMRSAQYDVEVVIEEFWEACEAGNQCYAIFDTPAEVGGELIGQTIVTQEGEVLGALLAGEVGTLAENAAILGAWGGAIGSSAIIPSLVAVTGGLATVSMVEMLKSDDNKPTEDNTPPSLTVVAPDHKAETNPTISGKTTAPAGTDVTITITDKDGKEIQSKTAKVQKDGSYSVAFSNLPEGAYTATAVIKNAQGQEIAKVSDPGSVAVTPEVSIDVPTHTADTTPTIIGTAPAGSEVTITVKDAQGKEQKIPTKADKNGNFSVDPAELVEGEYTVTAVAKDAFGNTSEPVSKTGSVDSSLPEVTVEVPENTNDATPAITGKAPAGSEVTIIVKDAQGKEQTIKATAKPDGTFEAVPTDLVDGAYTVTAQVTAPNGKIVEAKDNGNIDTVAPTLTLTIPENTADSTPTIKGHSDAPEGSKVAITVEDGQGNKQTIEATVKADGTFEVDVPKDLADGEYKVKASVQDEAGNIANAEQAIKVDSSLPEVTVEVPENTNDATPAIKGKAPAGSEVAITVKDAQGKEQTIKATADKDGNFSTDVPKDLADGKYDVTAKATDPNGKTAEAKDHGIIDTVAPEVYLNAPDNSRTATPTLNGKTDAPAGSEVTITVEDAQGKEQTITATVKPDGTFEAKIPEGLADGAYTAKATVVDTAGNKGASSDGGSVSTKAPDAPQSYQDNVGDVQDPKSTAPTTDDTTPSLNIGKVPAGETTKLYDNGKEIDAVYDPATGTLTPKEPLGEGKHNLSYTLTDPAGNESPQSDPIAIEVDITVPKAPTITIGSNENGESKDQITFDEVQTNGTVKTKVTLPNDAKEGDVLKIDTGSGAPIKTVITKEHLKDGYTFDLPIPKTGDKYDQGQKIQISATIIDKAGNTSEKGLANSTVNTNFDGEDTSYSENAKVGGIKTGHIFAGVVKASGSTESLFWNDGKPSTTSADGFYLLEKNTNGSYNMFLTPKGIADSEHSDFETGKNIFNYTILAKYADGVQKIGNWQVNLTNAADKAPSVTSQILNNPEENIVLTGGMENDKGLPENEILSVTFNGKTWTSADGGLVVQPDGTWTLKTGMKVNDLDNGSYNVDAKTTIKGEDPNSPMSSKMEDPSSGEITIAKPVDDKKLVLALNSDTAGAGTAGTNSDNITSDGVINVNNTNGNPWEYSLDGGKTWQAGTGTSFTLPESTEPNGTPYSLVARVTGNDTTKATLNMTLDQTTEFKVNGASGGNDGTISGTGEAGGLVKIGYQDATGKEVTSEATVGADGKWTMPEPTGWDSDVNPNNQEDKYAQITFVDKAGNTTKNGNNYLYVFDSLKNLNESYTVSDRPQDAKIYEGEFTGYGGKKISGLTFDYTPVKGNITIISTSTGPVTTSTFSGTNAKSGNLRIWRNLTGDGDDTVILNGDVWTNVGFFLGEGNNKVDIGGGIEAGSAKLAGSAGVAVVTGAGDDILNIKNSSLDGAFDLGAGNNTITVGKQAVTHFDRNRITTKEGNDKVTIQDDVLSSVINLGDGENILNIGGRLDFGNLSPNDADASLTRVVAQIITGKDKDVVTIGGKVDGGSVINLGDGDNSLTVKDRVDGFSKITTGDGNDTIDINGRVDGHSFIKTGAGNDTVTITGRVDGNWIIPNAPKTLIDLGDGDDTLTLEGVYQKSEVLGGAGTDHLHITGNGTFSWSYNTVNMERIGGFEHIHLDGNKVNLDLNYSDLLSSAPTGGATGTVYIHGDNEDRVDLGDNGNSLNDNRGTWSAKATETVENVEYQVYQHSTDATGEHLVYIQTGIEVI